MQIIINKKELVNTFIALVLWQVGTVPFSFYIFNPVKLLNSSMS